MLDSLPLPTVADHAETLIHTTDFLGDLDGIQIQQEMTHHILNCMADFNASTTMQLLVMEALRDRGWAILDGRRLDAEMALADAVEAGDLDRGGEWIEYDRYPA